MADSVASETTPAPEAPPTPAIPAVPPKQPQSVRAFLESKFSNLAAYLIEGGADPELVAQLRGYSFDLLASEMIRRALPHRHTDYTAAASAFLYELGVSREGIAEMTPRTARYLVCFAEVLGVETRP